MQIYHLFFYFEITEVMVNSNLEQDIFLKNKFISRIKILKLCLILVKNLLFDFDQYNCSEFRGLSNQWLGWLPNQPSQGSLIFMSLSCWNCYVCSSHFQKSLFPCSYQTHSVPAGPQRKLLLLLTTDSALTCTVALKSKCIQLLAQWFHVSAYVYFCFISKLVFKIDSLNLELFYLNLPFYGLDISTVYSC